MADPVPTPFAAYQSEVRPEWVDYNGHLHDAAYATVLSDAHEAFLGWLGLSDDYRAATGAALYTVEMHLRFLAEAHSGQRLTATTLLVAAGTRTITARSEIHADAVLVATGEATYVHVDTAAGRACAFPADRLARLDAVRVAHGPPRPLI